MAHSRPNVGSSSQFAGRLPFFYGWIMVANMFTAGMASAGPTLWAFSIFVVPMTNELGWSRGTMLLALTLRSLFQGFLAPVVGRMADNLERPKMFMVAGGTIYSIAIALLGTVHSQLAYYAIFVGLGGIGLAISGGNSRAAYVAKWFVTKRGRAITMGTMGTALAAFLYPLPTQLAIDALGWRAAWAILGVSSFILLVPIAFVIYRQPEDIGLLPDGETPEEAAESRALRASAGVREEYSFSVKEVIRMPTVWLLVAATVVVGPTPQGLTSSWVPHFRDIGIGAAAATTALSIYGLFSLLSRFVWGHFVDRHHVRNVLIVQMLMTSVAVFILIQVATPLQAMLYSAYQGFVLGGYIGMSPLVYPTYFGRRHVGAIQGTLTPLVTISSAGGPFLIATVFDLTGSYRGAYWVIMVTWIVAAGLMYLARPPKPPAEHESPLKAEVILPVSAQA